MTTASKGQTGAILVGAGILIAIVVGAFLKLGTPRGPNLTPIDDRNLSTTELVVSSKVVSVELENAVMAANKELTLDLKVTNKTSEPVRPSEFVAAGLQFLNPDVITTKPNSSDFGTSPRGLSVDPSTPIAPNETKEISVKVGDGQVDSRLLESLAYSIDNQVDPGDLDGRIIGGQLNGLIFFVSTSGVEFTADIRGPVAQMTANAKIVAEIVTAVVDQLPRNARKEGMTEEDVDRIFEKRFEDEFAKRTKDDPHWAEWNGDCNLKLNKSLTLLGINIKPNINLCKTALKLCLVKVLFSCPFDQSWDCLKEKAFINCVTK